MTPWFGVVPGYKEQILNSEKDSYVVQESAEIMKTRSRIQIKVWHKNLIMKIFTYYYLVLFYYIPQ